MKVKEQCRRARGGARRRYEGHATRPTTLVRQRADGNGFVPTKKLAAAAEFGVCWTDTADMFLSAGFRDPAQFVQVLDELQIRDDAFPDDVRLWTFKVLAEAGDLGIRSNMQTYLTEVIDGHRFIDLWPPDIRDDVRRLAHIMWHTQDLHTHGLWLRDFAHKAWVYKYTRAFSRNMLSSTRPIGELVKELVDAVQR